MSSNRQEAAVKAVTEIASGLAQPKGIEIVDVELLGGGKHRVLRVFIDKPQGVTLDDCETISHALSEALDAGDVIPGEAYNLEVSSPGVERKLSKPQHFERFLGQKAKVILRTPVDNQRSWVGTLAGFSDGVVTLEPAPGKSVRFALEQIEKANLKFDW
ncbi:MAG: ribosome maturation factor RimP [Bryobacteraceae bacterium]